MSGDIFEHLCPHCGELCGHTTQQYWHRLTPGLVGVLIKIRRAVRERGENSVHLQRDLRGRNELTRIEYNNAQKLRLHGLIAHSDEGPGYWLLTRRGREFLDGERTVPARVLSRDNAVVDHDSVQVSVENVMGNKPAFDDYEFWHSSEPAVAKQAELAL